MDSSKTILLAGKKCAIAEQVRRYLQPENFTLLNEDFNTDNCARITLEPPDLVILVITSSDRTGFDICKQLRSDYSGLILVIMQQSDDCDRILALELGADDVLVYPFSDHLLLVKIHALFRRKDCRKVYDQSRSISIGDLTVDTSRREAFLDGSFLDLTRHQFDLLWYLVEHAGIVVTRDNLYRDVFNLEYDGVDRSIDVYISRLRQKLGDDPVRPSYLKTVRGLGYLFARNKF